MRPARLAPGFRRHLLRTLLAFAVVLAPSWAAQPAAAARCRALDGDTVQCGRERIRLKDVHAAEKGSPGAEAQRRALQRKLDSGEVRIRRHGKDAWGRSLGDVYVGGRKVRQSDIGPAAGRGAGRAGGSRSARSDARDATPTTTARAPRAQRAHGPRFASQSPRRGARASSRDSRRR